MSTRITTAQISDYPTTFDGRYMRLANGVYYAATKALATTLAAGLPNGVQIVVDADESTSPVGLSVRYTVISNSLTSPVTMYTSTPGSGVAGLLPKSVAGNSNVTLSAVEAAYSAINLTGALTGNINVIVPNTSRLYLFQNNTTGAFTITVKTAAGTGMVVQQGYQQLLNSDGTNVWAAASNISSAGLVNFAFGAIIPTPAAFDSSTNVANTNFVYQAAAGMAGGFRNLKIVTQGATNFSSVITADTVVLTNAAGQNYAAKTVNVTGAINTSGANGLDTGSVADSTWYYVYVIYNPTTTTKAALFSTSATTPTLPTGYTFFARVGTVRSQAASPFYLLQTLQYGRRVQYVVTSGSNVATLPVMTSGAQGSAGSTFATVAVGNFIPPTASIIRLLLEPTSSTGGSILAAPNNSYVPSWNTSNMAPLQGGNGSSPPGALGEFVLESTNIYVMAQPNSNTRCMGWEDNL